MEERENYLRKFRGLSNEDLLDRLWSVEESRRPFTEEFQKQKVELKNLSEELEREKVSRALYKEENKKLVEQNSSLVLQLSDLETTIRTLIKLAKV